MKFPIATLLYLVLTVTPCLAQEVPSLPREISVTADASGTVAPDTARITFLLSGSGKTAAEAEQAISSLQSRTVAALTKAAGAPLSLALRAKSFRPPQGTALQPNTIIKVEKHIAVETTKLDTVALLIDAALQAGVSSVESTEYYAQNKGAVLEQLVADATTSAAKKAQLLAQQLSLTLGPVRDVSVTESPAAKMLLEKRRLGGAPVQFADVDLQVYVTMRYAIQ